MDKINKFEKVVNLQFNNDEKKEHGTLYHCKGEWGEGVAFLCPCGCGEENWIPINEDTRINKTWWDLKIESDLSLTLSPSILYLGKCNSHYFIRESKVVWC